MKRYRRHAIVIILIVGAVITPTSDVFTLMMVSVPMYLLYEVSIWIVSRIGKKQREGIRRRKCLKNHEMIILISIIS